MTNAILTAGGVHLGCMASSREEAIHQAGEALVALGAVSSPYVSAMWERELVISSFVGELTAIPHGTHASREFVNFAQLTIHRYLEPIDWDGESVMLTVGIASANDDHVELLGTLAEVLMEPSQREVLFTSQEPAEIVELIGKAFTNP